MYPTGLTDAQPQILKTTEHGGEQRGYDAGK